LDVGAPALEQATGEEHAELCLRLARAAIDDRRWTQAEEYVARAGRPDDPRSSTLAADAAHGDARVDQAAALAEHAVRMAETKGTPDQLCEAWCVRGRIARAGDQATATAAFAKAAQVAAEHGLPASRVEALFGLGTLRLLHTENPATIRTARELALDLGLLSTALSADLLLCDHELLDEGPRSTLPKVARLVEQSGTLRLHGLQAMSGTLLAAAYAATGDLPEMEDALTAVGNVPGSAPDIEAMTDAARAHAALIVHDLPRATDGSTAACRGWSRTPLPRPCT
jgi:hypothetical protein